MMKKLTIKDLGGLFLWPFKAFRGWAQRKMAPPLRIKMTRDSLMIALPASQGGRLHVLPRPGGRSGLARTFEVLPVPEGGFALMARPDAGPLATYDTEIEALAALATLNKVFTANAIWKWAFRLFLAWLVWLFVTSYMDVVQQQSSTSQMRPDLLGQAVRPAGPVAEYMPAIPSEPEAFRAVPSVKAPDGSDLADYIFKQAKAAQAKGEKDALPPKVSVDNAKALESFGLKGAAQAAGEGCDPDMAFKVPKS